MTERTLAEEVVLLREENRRLGELLEQALGRIAKLEAELEQVRNSPPSPPAFVKASRTKKKDDDKQQRRKRAKEQNGARRRDTPTQTIQHKLEQCPTCAYPLRHPRLAGRRQVIELPPPQPVDVTEQTSPSISCTRVGVPAAPGGTTPRSI